MATTKATRKRGDWNPSIWGKKTRMPRVPAAEARAAIDAERAKMGLPARRAGEPGAGPSKDTFFQMRLSSADSSALKWYARARGFKSAADMVRTLVNADYRKHRATVQRRAALEASGASPAELDARQLELLPDRTKAPV